jgi:hypothetical protein
MDRKTTGALSVNARFLGHGRRVHRARTRNTAFAFLGGTKK